MVGDAPSVGAIGGAANELGSAVRAGVAVWFIAYGARNQPVPALDLWGDQAVPTVVRCETDSSVDDLEVRFKGGNRALVQCKASLTLQRSGSRGIGAAIRQWARIQPDDLDPNDRLVIAVARPSASIRSLRGALARRRDPLSGKMTRDESTALSALDDQVAVLGIPAVPRLLDCATILVLDITEEGLGEAAVASQLLDGAVVGEGQGRAAFRALRDRFRDAAILRTGIDQARLELILREDGFNVGPLLQRRQGTGDNMIGLDQPHTIQVPTDRGRKVKVESAPDERFVGPLRAGLKPRTLPAVTRTGLSECLPRLLEAMENEPRIFMLLGPGGAGKSVMLGQIFDALEERGSGWAVLCGAESAAINADDLASPESVSLALAMTASRQAPLGELATELTARFGPGVVLVDTLDLLLTPRSVPAVSSVMYSCLTAGACVVAACRDYDYEVLCRPEHERLRLIAPTLDRWSIGQFTSAEVKTAVLAYLAREEIFPPQGRDAFADGLLDLSFQSQSLDEVVRRPLLLAMTAEIFGPLGHVPQELTITQLYEAFWEERVGHSRTGDADRIHQKTKLSLEFARRLYARSSVAFVGHLDEAEGATLNSRFESGWEELRSEGVLVSDRSKRWVSFFHQTFAEYAMSRWLDTADGAPSLTKLLDSLRRHPDERLHRWSVFRMLAAAADEERYEQLRQRLPLQNLSAFRAFAWTVSDRTSVRGLEGLLETALTGGPVFQDVLRSAAEAAPTAVHGVAIDWCVGLLARGDPLLGPKVAQTLGTLVARSPIPFDSLIKCLPAVDEAGHRRTDVGEALWDQFLRVMSRRQAALDDELLAPLAERYGRFGTAGRRLLIELHMQERAGSTGKRRLLSRAVRQNVPASLRASVARLTVALLPDGYASDPKSAFQAVEIVLRSVEAPARQATRISIAAAGLMCARKPTLLRGFIAHVLQRPPNEDPRALAALIDACTMFDCGSEVAQALVGVDSTSISDSIAGVVNGLVCAAAHSVSAEAAEDLFSFCSELLYAGRRKVLPAVIDLAGDSVERWRFALNQIGAEPDGQRRRLLSRLLLKIPANVMGILAPEIEATWPESSDTDARSARLQGVLAVSSEEARSEVVRMIAVGGRGEARQASTWLLAATTRGEWPDVSTLVPLLDTRTERALENVLASLHHRANAGMVANRQADELWRRVSREARDPIASRYLEVLTAWLLQDGGDEVSLALADGALESLLGRPRGPATLRTLFALLKAAAASVTAWAFAEQWVRRVFTSLDSGGARDAPAWLGDAILVLARRRPELLPALLSSARDAPLRNASALVRAMIASDGPTAPALEDAVRARALPDEALSIILESRDRW